MTINTEEFLQTTTTEGLDDTVIPCPPGDWLFLAGKPDFKTFEYKSGDLIGEQGCRCVIRWECQDDEPKKHCGRDKVSVTQSVLLDVMPDGSGLDMGKGKNIGLGKIRTALGQNTPGQPWSPIMIEGQPARLSIKAGVWNDDVTAEINGISAP